MQLYITDFSTWQAEKAALSELISPYCAACRAERAAAMRSGSASLGVLAAGLLLRYALGCTDDALMRDANGKPYLPGGPQFSLSHGGTLAAILISSTPCGVDVEPLDRRILHESRLFTPQERSSGYCPAALWTRKEALCKADGRGLPLLRTLPDASAQTLALDKQTYVLTTHLVARHAVSCAAQKVAPEPVLLSLPELLP